MMELASLKSKIGVMAYFSTILRYFQIEFGEKCLLGIFC